MDAHESTRPDEQLETAVEVDRGSLFECPSCETVYIAAEKTRCTRCDVAVEDVQPGRPVLAGPD